MATSWLVLSSIIAVFGGSAGPSPAPAPAPAATFPPHGGSYVTTLPSAASAWLDGSYVGETPVFVDDLLVGRHTLTISRSGWQPQTESFDVFAGRITPVSLVMLRVAPRGQSGPETKGTGMLAVLGGPPGAHVYIDGVETGALPVQPRPLEAGYHIVTMELTGKPAQKMVRIVDVYPESTTAVQFAAQVGGGQSADPDDELLEPLDLYVPASNVVIVSNSLTIHYRNAEVECEIGSRSYTFNGRAGTLAVPPALVGGRIYLPRSLLLRLAGK